MIKAVAHRNETVMLFMRSAYQLPTRLSIKFFYYLELDIV